MNESLEKISMDTAKPIEGLDFNIDGPSADELDEVADIFDDVVIDLDESAEVTDIVRTYLKQIGKIALINAEKEVELAKRIEAGLYANHLLESTKKLPAVRRRDLGRVAVDGGKAKDHLTEANLRLVVSLAKRYQGKGMDLMDLIQEGNTGLIRAVEKFDYTKGFKFSTYATWWIRQAITRGLADKGRTIRIPVHMVDNIYAMNAVKRRLDTDLDRPATNEEIAAEMDNDKIDAKKVAEMRIYEKTPISLSVSVGGDVDGSELGDFIPGDDENTIIDAVSKGLMAKILDDALTEREAYVMKLRFGLIDGEPRILDYIGARLGVTRERVRQIEKDAMVKLRRPSRIEQLREYSNQ